MPFSIPDNHLDTGKRDKSMAIKSNHKKRDIFQSIAARTSRNLKRFYNRFLKLRGSPRQASLGMAMGVFVGMSPFIGFHTELIPNRFEQGSTLQTAIMDEDLKIIIGIQI